MDFLGSRRGFFLKFVAKRGKMWYNVEDTATDAPLCEEGGCTMAEIFNTEVFYDRIRACQSGDHG